LIWRGRLTWEHPPSFRLAVAGNITGKREILMHRRIQLTKTTSCAVISQATGPKDSKAIKARFPSLIAGFRPALSNIRHRLAFPLLCLGAGLLLAQPSAAAPFEWQTTGSLTNAVVDHTATLLTDG